MSDERIKILDETTANKIAAGEVVERPASAVKELVENSIDAGSTRIEVEIQEGGLRLIRVTDNGYGMSKNDARLSLARHATSKIQTAEDLNRVSTLGFRGEALPSIASVSRFTVITRRTADLEGTEIVVEGGQISGVSAVGCPAGTTIM
ncbi:MAG TPA: DNA mismatch repair endonuclease MutL, partial [Negativicutes bacterium]|nr:DNA mismatch repair endonuclease MutL [Negativicutes bacterium]